MSVGDEGLLFLSLSNTESARSNRALLVSIPSPSLPSSSICPTLGPECRAEASPTLGPECRAEASPTLGPECRAEASPTLGLACEARASSTSPALREAGASKIRFLDPTLVLLDLLCVALSVLLDLCSFVDRPLLASSGGDEPRPLFLLCPLPRGVWAGSGVLRGL